jgi:hypothetical protein
MKKLFDSIRRILNGRGGKPVFWFKWTIRFALIFALLNMSGCGFNGRIWGDNFLRGWFRDNHLSQKIHDERVISNTGVKDATLVMLSLAVPIPFLLLLAYSLHRVKNSRENGLRFLVSAIEESETLKEVKRLSMLFGRTNLGYDRLVKRELKRIQGKGNG